jgi:adenylate cyclase
VTEERAKRKLTAIFSADVKGYSRLMADDEEATVRTINSYREVMTGLINGHAGRVVDAKGDNVLAEFSSVVDAVRCAVELQGRLKERNSELPEHRRMEFRIGVNLGDVIQEKETIYGDGVNVAARLEGLADPGGLCISGTAFDQVRDKVDLGYEYLGEKSVKNIPRPVRAYKVLMDSEYAGKVIGEEDPRRAKRRWAAVAVVVVLAVAAVGLMWNFYLRPDVEPASKEKMAFPLPDKPSIAVMPFVNMSGDQGQEPFCDGLSESIITALAKVPQLFVIGRDSTFSYKGKVVKAKQVSEELGVQYVLEGSSQRDGDRLRITAQLIDALKGHQLWAERYDRELKDLFVVQDEITLKVITALQVKITHGDFALITAKGTDNLEAYLKTMEALYYAGMGVREGYERGKQLADEAIALDPNFPGAYHALGTVQTMDVFSGFSNNPRESMELANKMQRKAIELDGSFAAARAALGFNLTFLRRHDEGLAEAERAYEQAPNFDRVLLWYGTVLWNVGRPQEAVSILKWALRLNPKPTNGWLRSLGRALWGSGQYGEAIPHLIKAVEKEPDDLLAHVVLAATYSAAGQEQKARASANEVLRINPKFSVERFMRAQPYKDQATRARFAQALVKAGLPEYPPLPLPDKPSIAVLPFDNMSGDPEQEYFSDGISEEIITALSKIPKLFVIARNSSFTYKGKSVWIPTVGKELGVRYVLEGSVRKSGDRVRITAQLIDVPTNKHLWAERYDRDLKDIFAIQDEITKRIIAALQVRLTEGEQARVYERGTKNLDAYLKVLQAAEIGRRHTKEANLKARQLAEEAISLDPNYASAYRELGATHMREVWLRISKSPPESLKKAAGYAKKALALDEALPPAHTLLGQVLVLAKDFDKAIAEGQRVVDLDPNGAESQWYLGMALVFAGRAEEAIPCLELAIRLDPSVPSHYSHILALAHWYLNQHDEAIRWGQKSVERSPGNQLSNAVLILCYGSSGRDEDARVQAAKLLEINPKYCVQGEGGDRFKDPEANRRYRETMLKAGVPLCQTVE